MQEWDKIFEKEGVFFTKPQADMPKVVRLFKKNKVKRILDLGCGTGRHVVYLAKKGFDVYGLDESKTGIKIAKEWLKKENLTAGFKLANHYDVLPYKDNFFDAIVSTQALHHGRTKEVEKVISEVCRVLKAGGMIFITVTKKLSKQELENSPFPIPKSKLIEKNVYVPLEGHEKGLPHFLFNKTRVRKMFAEFAIQDIHYTDRHCCFVGIKKRIVI